MLCDHVYNIYLIVVVVFLNFSRPEPQSGQSGPLPLADAILSSLPRILADPAASKVLMLLWSKRAPDSIRGKRATAITIDNATDPAVLGVFRDVTLKLYRAFGYLDAQPSRLKPVESAAALEKRIERIREYVGIVSAPVPGAAAGVMGSAAAAAAAKGGGPVGAAAAGTKPAQPAVPMLHTAFNAKELMWKSTDVLR